MGSRLVATDSGIDTPLREYLGDRTAKALAAGLNLHTARDLLFHLPRRYANNGEITELGSLSEGELATVFAKVLAAQWRPMRSRSGELLEVRVGDSQDSLWLTFFNQRRRGRGGHGFVTGRYGIFAGKVSSFRSRKQLTNPTYMLLPDGVDDDPEAVAAFARDLIPVYPATGEMASWKIEKAVRIVLDQLDWSRIEDPIPASVRAEYKLLGLETAIRAVHRPDSKAEVASGLLRLRWDEALASQVALAVRRNRAGRQPALARPRIEMGLVAGLEARLPFQLTRGQREVGAVLEAELASATPMRRLLQGEVGSGKTLVALRAMLQVVEAGGQAALLAPTEVLASQHLRSLRGFLGPLADRGLLGGHDQGTRLALLAGSSTAAARRQALAQIASGEAGIVVGTHALLEKEVIFHDLGLVVIDEQHRFGVRQRAALTEKARPGTRPHLLVMTATPIPRTVAMTVFGDLETSVLSDMPKGRSGVITHVVPTAEKPAHYERVWRRIAEEVDAGRQAYVVCPRIDAVDTDDAGETDSAAAATADSAAASDGAGPWGSIDEAAEYEGRKSARRGTTTAVGRHVPAAGRSVVSMEEELRTGLLVGKRIGLLHGRMSPDEKEKAMRQFAAGPASPDGIDVLVSTTVVEVGVDVHNATVMAIVDADRFGVSTLHQLRGRVGRGAHSGLCLLLTESPPASAGRSRLEAVAAEPDGFKLARLDLSERREGDVFGAVQAGRQSSLRLLSLLRDEEIILAARTVARRIVAADPELNDHLGLAAAMRLLLPEEADVWLERV